MPVFETPLPIIVVSGKYSSGKTIFGLSVGKRTRYYDFELSGVSYKIPGITRITVSDKMREAYPTGYRPTHVYEWFREEVKGIKPGEHDAIFVDTVLPLEAGITEYVRAHPREYGATPEVYQKMSGIMWGHVKDVERALLLDLASRCECLIISVHMGEKWADNKPTGVIRPKGKDVLMELASLFLILRREVQADGSMSPVPQATVVKARLSHLEADEETGDLVIKPILPPKIPKATPGALRKFMAVPANYKNLPKDQLAVPETMSDEEKAVMELSRLEAEREKAEAVRAAEQARLDYLREARSAVSAQIQLETAANTSRAAASAVNGGPISSLAGSSTPPARPDPAGGESPPPPPSPSEDDLRRLSAYRSLASEAGIPWEPLLESFGVSDLTTVNGGEVATLVSLLRERLWWGDFQNQEIRSLVAKLDRHGIKSSWAKSMEKRGVTSPNELDEARTAQLVVSLKEILARKEAGAQAAPIKS